MDEETWYVLTSGYLTREAASQIARVSSPLGTAVKLGLWFLPVIASIRIDDGSVQSRNYCNGEGCGYDHSTLTVGDVAFNVVVRSI